jgi:hypothetical protein
MDAWGGATWGYQHDNFAMDAADCASVGSERLIRRRDADHRTLSAIINLIDGIVLLARNMIVLRIVSLPHTPERSNEGEQYYA